MTKDFKITDALIYDAERMRFVPADLVVRDGIFTEISPSDAPRGDKYIVPGLIDVHTHGRNGFDFVSASVSDLVALKGYYAAKGVTTVVPTLASDTLENMLDAVTRIEEAGYPAVHIEGRYLNVKHRGAHKESLLTKPSANEAELFFERAKGMKMHFTAAYELDDGSFLTAVTEHGGSAGLGHTDADYDTAGALLNKGVRSFTHLFNAMPPLHHRHGGAAMAGLLSDAYTEIICDGFHLAKEAVALVRRTKDIKKVVLITDSMEGTGCSDGEYSIAGNKVLLRGGKAYTLDGAIAGSTLELLDGVKNYASYGGAAFEEALLCATKNPAEMLGLAGVGEIKVGNRADFLILDKDYDLKAVYVGGKKYN